MADRRLDQVGYPPDNARLIAAAPDLLAALKAMVELVEGTEDTYGLEDMLDSYYIGAVDFDEVLAKAKEAIKKAEP